MLIETVLLTPEEASKILAVSEAIVQRPLRSALVDRIARSISAGEWRSTHQAIALDGRGAVIDGQHRLHAIVKAGVPVMVTIARDVDPASFDVIDTGASRTPGDVLHIAGHARASILAAGARYLLSYDAIAGTTELLNTYRSRFSTRQILAEANSERGKVLASAIPVGATIARNLGRNGFGAWIAVFVTLLRTEPDVNPSTAVDFLGGLRDGTNLSAGSPILALRRYLSSDSGLVTIQNRERIAVGLAVSIKSYNRWIAGETSQLVAFKAGIERMPRLLPPPPKHAGEDE